MALVVVDKIEVDLSNVVEWLEESPPRSFECGHPSRCLFHVYFTEVLGLKVRSVWHNGISIFTDSGVEHITVSLEQVISALDSSPVYIVGKNPKRYYITTEKAIEIIKMHSKG